MCIKNKPIVSRTRFLPLRASYMRLLRVLISLLDCLCSLRLARVINLVCVARNSVENPSNGKFSDDEYYSQFSLKRTSFGPAPTVCRQVFVLYREFSKSKMTLNRGKSCSKYKQLQKVTEQLVERLTFKRGLN